MKSTSVPINLYVKQIKASNEKAFKKLFDILWEPLYVYSYSLLEDETLAKDMVQEVWIDFWERRKQIHNDNVKAYLYTAVRYRVLKEIRDTKLKTDQLETLKMLYAASEDEATEALSTEETRSLLDAKLAVLPEKCREVFQLSRINGLKNKEIAAELGISESTVEKHITKAVKLLKGSSSFMVSIFI